jgi:hypothetical protein
MVITLSLLLPNAAGQLNTLVNFGSALPCLAGQFSVGANTPPKWWDFVVCRETS